VPKYPPEYFADMAISHRKTLAELLNNKDSHWRLLTQMPDLDKDKFGQLITTDEFEKTFDGRYDKYFNALCKIREGELLQFSGTWRPLTIPTSDSRPRDIANMHVQYANSHRQRTLMEDQGLPGTPKKTHRRPPGIAQKMSQEMLSRIGTTTVCKLGQNGNPKSMKEAKVVTWPQLFILGRQWGFSAMEIFATGSYMERIMSQRIRPTPGVTSTDAAHLRFTHSGKWRQGSSR
jgi:hypothetical protein